MGLCLQRDLLQSGPLAAQQFGKQGKSGKFPEFCDSVAGMAEEVRYPSEDGASPVL
jgi:hypothetical protein